MRSSLVSGRTRPSPPPFSFLFPGESFLVILFFACRGAQPLNGLFVRVLFLRAFVWPTSPFFNFFFPARISVLDAFAPVVFTPSCVSFFRPFKPPEQGDARECPFFFEGFSPFGMERRSVACGRPDVFFFFFCSSPDSFRSDFTFILSHRDDLILGRLIPPLPHRLHSP